MGRNFSFEDVHVEGTERIVEAVAKYDVDRYIHVSAYNANPASTSEFFATKVLAGTSAVLIAEEHVDPSGLTLEIGPRRTSCAKHFPGDNHRAASTDVRV